jgi:YidC/Oxa1 family membrane protein insertase
MTYLFHTLVSDPLYNALIGIINVVPWGDVGIAIIILTIIVKLLLYPLSRKMARTNAVIKRINPQIEEIKKEHPKREDQVVHMMALYKKHHINPFSGVLLIFIQLPIIIGLYWLFFSGTLPEVDMERLYAFVSSPDMVSMNFLGIIDVSGRSIILAILAGLTQFIHARMTVPAVKAPTSTSFKDSFAHSMNIQMRYMLPLIIGVMAYIVSSAIALYFITSNVMSIIQERFVRRELDANTSTNETEVVAAKK